jgi:AcrR family transcriptional regulator
MATKKKPARRSREDWIGAALAALRDSGIERVRVEPLAEVLGVTKGSFYWHFKDREELVSAALDSWVERGTLAIIRDVSATDEDPRQRMRSLWARVLREASLDLRTELAIRELAQRDASVRERVRRVDEQRMGFLRGLFRDMGLSAADAEMRSLLLYSLLIGDYFIQVSHGRMTRASVLARAVDELLRVTDSKS